MIGLPIAVALGAIIGRSDYGLEVLKDSDADAVERGKRYIDEKRISISLKEGITEKLYIEVEASADGHSVTAIIASGHTNFVYLKRDNEVMLDASAADNDDSTGPEPELTLRRVYDFAMTAPVEEIEFILDSMRLNKAAAERAFEGDYGHSLGRTLRSKRELDIMGDSIFSRIIAYTAAACDARMAGAMIPVMSNSGSGNQGITATLPVVVYGEECGASREQMIRALTLSHLTVIYIKQSLGRLSALCGCVVAASGSSCGITYLMGGGYEEIVMAVKNMVANLTGMICDGVSTAVLSAMLAMEHRCVSEMEGIVESDVDRTIHNLTTIGRDGMNETDRLILNIMTSKC